MDEGKSGKFGYVSPFRRCHRSAKTHVIIKSAFLTFQKDADQIYSGWKEMLGYTGVLPVQSFVSLPLMPSCHEDA
jgi:hypothetical protein